MRRENMLSPKKAVKSTYDFAIVPTLHAVRPAEFMQAEVGLLHRRHDPGAVGIAARRRTSPDDLGESRVTADFEAVRA